MTKHKSIKTKLEELKKELDENIEFLEKEIIYWSKVSKKSSQRVSAYLASIKEYKRQYCIRKNELLKSLEYPYHEKI